MTATEILNIIETEADGGHLYSYFGIRSLHIAETPALGETLPDSYIWDDGDPTEVSLEGTCCFGFGADDSSSAIRLALERSQNYRITSRYALIAGHRRGLLDLIPETGADVIGDAVVLALWED